MTKIQRIAACIEKFAPASLAQSWDNTGILIDTSTPENTPILLTIDLTTPVLEECIKKNIKHVVCYHPVIFTGLKKITQELLIRIIQNGISVYSPHTQLDNMMNEYVKERIGEGNYTFDELVRKMKEIAGLDLLRTVHCDDLTNRFSIHENILVGVGATFRNIDPHTMKGCVLVTGEMSHHDLLKCRENGIGVILLEHSNSERIFLGRLKELIENEIKDCEIVLSEEDRDPVTIQ